MVGVREFDGTDDHLTTSGNSSEYTMDVGDLILRI